MTASLWLIAAVLQSANVVAADIGSSKLPLLVPKIRCRGNDHCVHDAFDLCICDLTEGACDVNCCCDLECNDNDRLAFTGCEDRKLSQSVKACVRKTVLFGSGLPQLLQEVDHSMFCIFFDNSGDANYYERPVPVTTSTEFDSLREKYRPRSSLATDNDGKPFSAYKSGDPVLVLYSGSMTLGHLLQPSPIASSMNCADSSPVAYLVSRTSTCTRQLPAISRQCESDPMLRASTFSDGFQLLQNSEVLMPYYGNLTHSLGEYALRVAKWYEDFKETGNPPPRIPVLDKLQSSKFVLPVSVDVGRSVCLDKDGLPNSCKLKDGKLPAPTWTDDETHCVNAVKEVAYTIYWGGNVGITRVSATFTLFTISIGDGVPTASQSFRTEYIQDNKAPLPVVRFSGNPGYVVGLPMRAGRLIKKLDEKHQLRLAIELRADYSSSMTMLSASDTSATCLQTTTRVPVKFGINMRSGCFITLNPNKLAESCELSQQAAYTALRGPGESTHVASFGNSLPESVGDWIEITGANEPLHAPKWSAHTSSTCENMLIGLDIKIVFAYIGSVENPQAQIIAANYDYIYAEKLLLKSRTPPSFDKTRFGTPLRP